MAVIVTGVLVATAVVDILNAGVVVAPAAICTVAGTAATIGLLLVSLTAAPAAGAGASRVTVFDATGTAPPTIDEGFRLTEATPSGVTVRVAVTATSLYLAVIVTGVLDVTKPVVIATGCETAAFAGTVTEDGTTAMAGLELESVIVSPPAGANPSRLTTFPVTVCPATTVPADNAKELGTAA